MDRPPMRDSERRLAELLVEERVAQLEEISRRRNGLLREMFVLLQRRHNFGEVISLPGEGEVGGTETLAFLEKFDLQKHPESGSVSMLTDEDLTIPLWLEQLNKTPTPEPSPHPEPATKSDAIPPTPPYAPVAQEHDEKSPAGQMPLPVDIPQPSPTSVHEEVPTPPVPVPVDEDLDTGKPEIAAETTSANLQDLSQQEPMPPADEEAEVIATSVPEAEIAIELDDAQPPAVSGSPSHPQDEPMEITQVEVAEPPPVPPPAIPTPPIEPTKPTTFAEPLEPSEPIEPPKPAEPTQPAEPAEPPSAPPMEVDDIPEVQPSQGINPQDTLLVPAKADKSLLPDMAYSSVDYPPSPITYQPPSFPSSVTVSSTLTPIQGLPDFAFPEIAEAPGAAEPALKNNVHFTLNRHYSVPSLKVLPAEFQRKGKLSKQRKRDKEREKAEKGSDRGDGRKEARDDWTPMGINKWGAIMRANPLWRRMSRATKCLSTHEWSVAFEELRFIRTLERIETLKDAGRWSYRQPKKQRGVGGLKKTHWDYLLDEMKWMRIDFREERKWKIALAYELSTAVLEWHRAGNQEERMRLGLIVDWHKPPVHDGEVYETPEELDDERMETDALEPENMMAVDYGSDDSDDDQEQDKQDVVDALETTALVEDALTQTDPANAGDEPLSSMSEIIRPKEEELEDPSVLRDNGQDEAMQVDSQPTEAAQSIQDTQLSASSHPGLKTTSQDPVLTANSQDQQNVSSVHAPALATKSLSKSNAYLPLRAHIAYSDEHQLFLDLDDFHFGKRHEETITESTSMDAPPAAVDLSSIFPDLQCFGVLDVAPVAGITSSTDGKKKQEKRDRDDPHKRTEDTTYSKLTPLGRFMREKPTLLGTLEPSKHWKGDHWSGIDDAPVVPDLDTSYKVDDGLSELFDNAKQTPVVLDDDTVLSGAPRDPAKRIIDADWPPEDDLLIRRLAEKYPRNWGLIADIFNSTRGAISTEKRRDWECRERYRVKWLVNERGDRDANSAQTSSTSVPARPQPQMTTRKRLASVSASAAPTNGASAPPVESRKRRRHVLMHDTIRKGMKKREASQKSANPRKPSVVHDTHGQYNKMPKLTPAELSRMKADKEAREQQEVLIRRRNEEYARQQMYSAQRMAAQGAAVQAAAPGTPNAAAVRQPPTGVQHHQTVPQIRSQVNISQQQRVPAAVPVANPAAAAAVAAARMSPQQLLQAQQAAAQQRALVAAAAAGNVNVNLAAAASNVNGHLSPPYASRAATSSPAVPQASPPRSSATPNPPRPASAQQHVGATQASPNMHQTAVPRPAANMGHYFPIPGTQLTPEQAIRIQQIMQQQRQAMQNGQTGQAAVLRVGQGDAWKQKEQGEEARYAHQKEQEQLRALSAAQAQKQESSQAQGAKDGKAEMDRDLEGGFGGQEDLEDRYATTSGEH
ncbi:hypothetical protein EVG20_g4430 [Dentipellis fragilis]|uniref:Vacuolar import and degradation protein 21 n=1 Tax=Dentipellis fragilis TaxID=205917 RepID=A0A4Y9YVP6_9AGAM|nr:hypothetical protein EVG20_g4430 [Dentipellis fragilis]